MTGTQVAQYIILIISYLVPVVYLSWSIFGIPQVPQLTYLTIALSAIMSVPSR